jgi:hypothetical protein
MIFSWMFDDYAELRPLKDVAYALAERRDWAELYDYDRLARNTVPVAGVSYYDDMYGISLSYQETVLAERFPRCHLFVVLNSSYTSLRTHEGTWTWN